MSRRLIVSALLLVALAVCAWCEVFPGLKKSLNISSQYGYDITLVQESPLLGFAGGLYLAWAVSENFVVQQEALVSRKGRQSTGSDYNVNILLTYLDFPLLLKFRYLHTWLTASVYAGAHYSDCLDGSVDVSGLYGHEQFPIPSQDLNPHDAGVLVGADFGLEILEAFNIYVDLRYTLGLLAALEFDRSRNSNLTLSVGYGFKL